MNKLKMQSNNLVDANVEKIKALFPNCVTEGRVDFDLLRQELSGVLVEGRDERYRLEWAGKRQAILTANSPISKTLRPVRAESVNFDTTENLYIEGDNLDVLKLLHETYLGKVKMIYIDPPYNTGNDFVYNDDFAESADEYLQRTGEVEDGVRMSVNKDTSGRYHSDWLSMMYMRLKIARDLMTDDGIIFMSIDDSEQDNLKKLCNEVFGESNFVAQIIWQNKKGGGNDSTHVAIEHEYILVFAKDKPSLHEFYEAYSDEYAKRYKQVDSVGRFFWDTYKRKSGKQYYPIKCPDGTVLQYDTDGNAISWLRSEARFNEDLKNGEVRLLQINGKWSVQFKQRMPQGKKPRSIFTTEQVIRDKGTTSTGGEDVYSLFKKDVFSNPKPVELLKFLIGFGTTSDSIILDFFSGSATIAEAVMQINAEDSTGGCRKFIAVQLQESIEDALRSPSANAKIVAENAVKVLDELKRPRLITEIAKERIRRAGARIAEASRMTAPNLDIGFRTLKLADSNMREVFYHPDQYDQAMLLGLDKSIKDDRTAEDVLFQVMLDKGVSLSSKIQLRNGYYIVGDTQYSLLDTDYKGDSKASIDLICCFDKISLDTIKEIAKLQPECCVFLDSQVKDDATRTNIQQIFATYSPKTKVEVL